MSVEMLDVCQSLGINAQESVFDFFFEEPEVEVEELNFNA